MAKKKPIVITIKELPDNGWTYSILKPRAKRPEAPKDEASYSRIWTAKRGALRHLGDPWPNLTSGKYCFPHKTDIWEATLEWRIERLKTKTKKGKK